MVEPQVNRAVGSRLEDQQEERASIYTVSCPYFGARLAHWLKQPYNRRSLLDPHNMECYFRFLWAMKWKNRFSINLRILSPTTKIESLACF
uniref:Uncharacterized protein n=1 Tax=Cannabis sativa TaxID=3483 RepID=A0A803QPM8_CANSA